MPTGQTAQRPSWARGLAAYEAQGSEDLAWLKGQKPAVTPEETYGFEPSGTTGRPGQIHGSTRQMDFTASRAARERTATPGSPMMTSKDIDQRQVDKANTARGTKYAGWKNFMQSQRPPVHGEVRRGGDGKPWRYNAYTGKGEPVTQDGPVHQDSGVRPTSSGGGASTIQSPSASAPTSVSQTVPKMTPLPLPPQASGIAGSRDFGGYLTKKRDFKGVVGEWPPSAMTDQQAKANAEVAEVAARRHSGGAPTGGTTHMGGGQNDTTLADYNAQLRKKLGEDTQPSGKDGMHVNWDRGGKSASPVEPDRLNAAMTRGDNAPAFSNPMKPAWSQGMAPKKAA